MAKDQGDDFEAVRTIVEALTPFERIDQERIIRWAREKIGLEIASIVSASSTLPPKPAVVVQL